MSFWRSTRRRARRRCTTSGARAETSAARRLRTSTQVPFGVDVVREEEQEVMRRALQFSVVALLAAIGSSLILPAASVSQPVAFNHAKHMGLTCAGCHIGIQTTARAGLPAPAVCAKCHATAPASI